jgi:hypothetical protein
MAFTIYSTVGKLMSNDQAKAVIDKHLPGASNHPQLAEAWGMTLGEIASFPEAGITQTKLQQILAELAQVSE